MLISWVCHKLKMNANREKSFLLQTMVRKKTRSVLYEVLLVSYGLGPYRKTVCTTRRRPCLCGRLCIYPFRRSIYEWIRAGSIQPKHKMVLRDFHYVPHLIKMEAAFSHETSVSTPKTTRPSRAYILPWRYGIWRSVSIIKTNRLMLFMDIS